jgi:hypothetical protein
MEIKYIVLNVMRSCTKQEKICYKWKEKLYYLGVEVVRKCEEKF